MIPHLTADIAANLLCNVLGIAGVALYAIPLLRQSSRNRLESTLLFLLLCMAVGLSCRTVSWAYGDLPTTHWVVRVELAFAFLIPLAFALFCESLLRKHLPLALKLSLVATTLGFELAGIAGIASGGVLMSAFAAFLVVAQLWMTCLLLFRARGELTPAENVLADSVAVALWLMVPLYLTDFHIFERIFHVRFGVLAVLIFIYALVRGQSYQDRKRTVFTELVLWAGQSLAIAAFGYWVVENRDPDLFFRLFALSLCLVLLYLIRKRVRFLELRSREAGFLRWLAGANTGSLPEFIDSLRGLKAEEEYEILGPRRLDGYDQGSLERLFERVDTNALRLAQARELSRKDGPESYAAEQLVDLLVKNGKDYVCALRTQPLVLFLVSMPQPGQEEMAELELGVIRKFGKMIEGEAI